MHPYRLLFNLAVVVNLFVIEAHAQTNVVNGNMFTLTDTNAAPNGVWSWFEDERAVVDWRSDPSNPRLLLSSVSAGNAPENGDIDLLWRNLSTGVQGHFELANQLEQDDHNSASLHIRPDGRILAMYSRHGTDNLTRWRISNNPHDPTSWGAEQTLNNGAGTTYNNTYFLQNDAGGAGRTYNFTRTNNYDPNIQISADNGTTWTNAGKLLTEGGASDRPYVRYASNGDKIFLLTTERHPRDFANNVFAGYVKDGVLHRMDGSVADSNLFDASGVAPSTLTNVFRNGSEYNGNVLNRAWTVSLELDKANNPVGIISARVGDSDQDHRFLYARYDGLDWQVNEIAKAGSFLYQAENDYTGLVSVDPDNPNVVYMSTTVNPNTDQATENYELYKGFTSDFGKSWTWTAITENSTMDNIRPVVAEWNGQNTALTWLRGQYNTYLDWSTEVVGINFASPDPKSLLWRGDDSGAPTSWDNATTSNWDSGGGLQDRFNPGDEVSFTDSANSTVVRIQSEVTPMAVAFANETKAYEVIGPGGIAGSGGLRVIGGGSVTLANGDNTYTGDTLVARGTLALAGETRLSGTQKIRVAKDGTLDTTALTASALTLANQTLTVEGTINGNIHATQGANVQLDASAAFNGNLNLDASTFIGDGVIAGNLVARSGSTIQIGSNGIVGTAQFAYHDATFGTEGNTTFADGSTFTPPPGSGPANAPTWVLRSGLANEGTVIQGGSNDPAELPTLRTTISGLTPGSSYQTYVNYWDASGSSWRILAGESVDSLNLYSAPNSTISGATSGENPATLDYLVEPLLVESNRRMWAGNVGRLVADANGQLSVYVDDTGTNDGDDRSWFDGITIETGNILFTGQSVLLIEGDLTIDDSSTIQFNIGDTAAFDKLLVMGLASFGGTLEVNLADNSPVLGIDASFDLMDFSNATGQFANYVLPSLGEGLRWDKSELYSQGILSISAIPEPSAIVSIAGLCIFLARRRTKRFQTSLQAG